MKKGSVPNRHERRAAAARNRQDAGPGLPPDLSDALRAMAEGRFAEAEAACRAALARQPDIAPGLLLLGTLLMEKGEAEEALAIFARLPRDRDPYRRFLVGKANLALGNWQAAADAYAEAAAIKPDYVDALAGRGHALAALGDTGAAAECYGRAAALDPDSAELHARLAALMTDLGRHAQALDHADRAAELSPDSVTANTLHGHVLVAAGRLDEALAAFERSRALRPDAGTNMDVAAALRLMGRWDEALIACRAAVAADPDNRPAQGNAGLLLLTLGRFAEGWEAYRRRTPAADRPLAADLAGETVTVESDQGLGDLLFFLRFVPALKARGARVAVRCDPRLAGICARVPGVDTVLAPNAEFEGRPVLAGDLPWLLGTPDPIPGIAAAPLPERVAALRARLAAFGPPPYVGVTWQAGTFLFNRYAKRVPVEPLAATLAPGDARVVLLQRRSRPEDRDAFLRALGRPALDLGDLDDDLEGLLAALAVLDDYVAVPNTNVHLRAAAGRPARVLVPHPPEFRWLAAGARSPWFPDLAVYRQSPGAGWDEAIAALGRDLGAPATVGGAKT